MRERQHNVFTIGDIEELGIDRVVEMALDAAYEHTDNPSTPLLPEM